jgi:hypothetical protein
VLPGVESVTGVGAAVEVAVPLIALELAAVILGVSPLRKSYNFGRMHPEFIDFRHGSRTSPWVRSAKSDCNDKLSVMELEAFETFTPANSSAIEVKPSSFETGLTTDVEEVVAPCCVCGE